MDPKQIQETLKKIQQLGIDPKQLIGGSETGGIKDIEEAKNHTYEFWKTQPVPAIDEVVTENTYILSNEYYNENVRQEPYSLPKGFEWSDIDINNADELNEVYVLLTENYVEDDDCMFRFDYGPKFLKWALTPPGWLKKWHCGVRATSSKKLLAFITAIPVHIRTYDKTTKMVEINFLCVHKKLRSKRVAPVLIREITRRVHLEGIFQAAFTAGIIIPKPIAACRYWHRSLNPKKLIDVGFSHLPRNSTIQRQIKLYKLPTSPKTQNIVPMEEKHMTSAFKLLSKYLEKFDLVPIYTEDDFRHFFAPIDNVIYSYVVEDDKGNVTDMCSFYNLPSTVVSHPKHKIIKAAYSFYNVATTIPYQQLMNDALIFAALNNFDVFNALNVMENSEEILKDLKFGIGDGNLHYYLYNWKCPEIDSSKVGLVLQ
uniref:Glycylpeptide N-tetradecanoyltransferase n=1 Tax=Parastrongyloides trichosuri TaxID=131310 RepID=A0A0N4ZPN0_PARTI